LARRTRYQLDSYNRSARRQNKLLPWCSLDAPLCSPDAPLLLLRCSSDAPLLLLLKRPCSLSWTKTAISNPNFGVYIIHKWRIRRRLLSKFNNVKSVAGSLKYFTHSSPSASFRTRCRCLSKLLASTKRHDVALFAELTVYLVRERIDSGMSYKILNHRHGTYVWDGSRYS